MAPMSMHTGTSQTSKHRHIPEHIGGWRNKQPTEVCGAAGSKAQILCYKIQPPLKTTWDRPSSSPLRASQWATVPFVAWAPLCLNFSGNLWLVIPFSVTVLLLSSTQTLRQDVFRTLSRLLIHGGQIQKLSLCSKMLLVTSLQDSVGCAVNFFFNVSLS